MRVTNNQQFGVEFLQQVEFERNCTQLLDASVHDFCLAIVLWRGGKNSKCYGEFGLIDNFSALINCGLQI